MTRSTRVGVIGCGLIAQVMHLPYLAELAEHFEIAALCDLSEPMARACAARYGVQRVHSRWQDLLADEIDAVMILTSGDHAPIAIEAANSGRHVFTEKPMALSASGGIRMLEAAREAGVILMVGTMKRYDPAYERLAQVIGDVGSLRLVRVTTLESPFAPYVAHYPLVQDGTIDPDQLAESNAADERALDTALGDIDEQTRWCYRWILLDNLVHEFNVLRGILGEPTEVRYADLSPHCASVNLRFGATDCHLSWVDLPGIARYKQEFAFYAPDERLTLEFPSPFLRNMPSRLIIEGGEPGTPHSWEREEIVSFEEAFRRELLEFADCIVTGREPRTSGADGLGDLQLCELIAHAHASRMTGIPIGPTSAGAVGDHS